MALDMASLRQRVLLVTLEQAAGELGIAALARYSGVSMERLDLAFGREKLQLSEQENEAVASAQDRLKSLELFFCVHSADKNGSSLEAVMHSATRRRFDAIFVDHLGMIDRDSGDELKAIPRAANKLRALTRGVIHAGYTPFVCVTSPLSRKRDEDDHPKLSHLRGSGNLEYDADLVMVVQKREKPEDSNEPNVVDGYVLKNRQGQCPVVLQFDLQGAVCRVTEHRKEEPQPQSHWQDGEGEDE